jgi:hypothetical protein
VANLPEWQKKTALRFALANPLYVQSKVSEVQIKNLLNGCLCSKKIESRQSNEKERAANFFCDAELLRL